jgi:hypothetical protein
MNKPFLATTYYWFDEDESQKELDETRELKGETGYCQIHYPLHQKMLSTGMGQIFSMGFDLSTKECNGENHPQHFYTEVIEPEFEKIFPKTPEITGIYYNPASLIRAAAERMFVNGFFELSTIDFNGETWDHNNVEHQKLWDEKFGLSFRLMIGVCDEEGYIYKMNQREKDIKIIEGLGDKNV